MNTLFLNQSKNIDKIWGCLIRSIPDSLNTNCLNN